MVVFLGVLPQAVDEEVELFVEDGLRRGVGFQYLAIGEIVAVAVLDDAASEELFEEIVGGAVEGVVAIGVGEEGFDGFGYEHEPLHPYAVVGGEVVQEVHFFFHDDGLLLVAGEVGKDAYCVELLDG